MQPFEINYFATTHKKIGAKPTPLPYPTNPSGHANQRKPMMRPMQTLV
ncbi:hypothetical protein [uncultured Duncaniella sp.]|nr:hypothetical protein [uncultured Duncaniella sp.]